MKFLAVFALALLRIAVESAEIIDIPLEEFYLELTILQENQPNDFDNGDYQRRMETLLQSHITEALPLVDETKHVVAQGNLKSLTLDTRMARFFTDKTADSDSTVRISVEGSYSFNVSFDVNDETRSRAVVEGKLALFDAFKGNTFLDFAEKVGRDSVLGISSDVSVFLDDVRVAKGVIHNVQGNTRNPGSGTGSDIDVQQNGDDDTGMSPIVVAVGIVFIAIAAFITTFLCLIYIKSGKLIKVKRTKSGSQDTEESREQQETPPDESFLDNWAMSIASIPFTFDTSKRNIASKKQGLPHPAKRQAAASRRNILWCIAEEDDVAKEPSSQSPRTHDPDVENLEEITSFDSVELKNSDPQKFDDVDGAAPSDYELEMQDGSRVFI